MDYEHLLKTRLAALETAPEPYRPTNFWNHGVKSLLKEMEQHGFSKFKQWPSASYWFYPKLAYGVRARWAEKAMARSAPAKAAKRFRKLPEKATGRLAAIRDFDMARVLWRQEIWPTDFNIQESEYGDPIYVPRIAGEEDGPRFNRAILNYMLCLAVLSRHVDERPKRFLELGGGFGGLGELLFALDPEAAYANYDLPPLSVVAEHYLNEAFPDFEHRVGSTWELPDHDAPVDVFVNTFSFQEMEPHVVENYVKVASALGARYVVSLNSTNGKRRAKSEKHVGVVDPVTSAFIEARFQAEGYETLGAYKDPYQRSAATMLVMRRADAG